MKVHGKGRSSFDLIDQGPLAEALRIGHGQRLLDLGCGNGAYLLHARGLSDGNGAFKGIDLWQEGIDSLRESSLDMDNVEAVYGDITARLPVEDRSIDVCLASTIMHDVGRENPGLLGEIHRVLKDYGRLVVIEFRPVEGPPGPPLEVRLAYEELTAMLSLTGLIPDGPPLGLGRWLYLAQYHK